MVYYQNQYEKFVNYIYSQAMNEDVGKAYELEQQLQATARFSNFLPRNLYPNKRTFEDVGFHFVDTTDPMVYKSTLPKGWRLEKISDYFTSIIDGHDYKRGFYVCKWIGEHRDGYTILQPRFYIAFMTLGDDPRYDLTKIYVKDACGKVDYSPGNCLAFTDSFTEAIHEAEEFLYEKYPDWRNPNLYWDE